MVELCSVERVGWTTLSTLLAFVSAIPWTKPLTEHGKLVRPAAAKGGPVGWWRAGVPKSLFTHFYAFGLAASFVALADVLFNGGSLVVARVQEYSACSRMAARTDDARGMVAEALACLVLLAVQEGRRFSECLAVTRWGSSRMSFAGYAIGVIHYQLMLLTVLAEAPPLGFAVDESGVFSGGLRNAVNVMLAVLESMKIRHSIAVGLFCVASARQHEAIRHLASLRASPSDEKPNISTYAMPTVGWFQYVSCPHYFAEVLIYSSFLLLAGMKGGGLGQGYLLALIWVFANQAFFAASSHAWYLTKFEDYPRERKRLIPGIW